MEQQGEAAERVLLELAQALHRAGTASARLESTVDALAERFGIEAATFSTPTALFVAFGPPGRQRVALLRERPAGISLDRLTRLADLARQVLEEGLTASETERRLEIIEQAPRTYPEWAEPIAFVLTSASAAVFFGGGPMEVLVAAIVGAVIGSTAWLSARWAPGERLFAPVSALLAAAIPAAAAPLLGPLEVATVTVSGLVILLPGLSLTLALREIGAQHLASGTARLAGALAELVVLAFGCACGLWIGGGVGDRPDAVPELHWMAWPLALLAAPVAFTVLFRARRVDLPAIILVALVAVGAGRFGAEAFGPLPGAVAAAFAVAAVANLHARLFRVPSAVLQVPGLILLVPGSVGFRSVWALLEHDVIGGVDAAFLALTLAIGIVTGIVIANVVIPSKVPGERDG